MLPKIVKTTMRSTTARNPVESSTVVKSTLRSLVAWTCQPVEVATWYTLEEWQVSDH